MSCRSVSSTCRQPIWCRSNAEHSASPLMKVAGRLACLVDVSLVLIMVLVMHPQRAHLVVVTLLEDDRQRAQQNGHLRQPIKEDLQVCYFSACHTTAASCNPALLTLIREKKMNPAYCVTAPTVSCELCVCQRYAGVCMHVHTLLASDRLLRGIVGLMNSVAVKRASTELCSTSAILSSTS